MKFYDLVVKVREARKTRTVNFEELWISRADAQELLDELAALDKPHYISGDGSVDSVDGARVAGWTLRVPPEERIAKESS